MNSEEIKFSYDAETLIKISDRKADEGDLESALLFLLDAKTSKKTAAEVYYKIAGLYYDMELYDKSLYYWYLLLDMPQKNREQYPVSEIYNGIASCYYALNVPAVAAYYFNNQLKNEKEEDLIGDYEDFENSEEGFDVLDECVKSALGIEKPFKVVYPPEAVDYSETLKKGKRLLSSGEREEALKVFDEIHPSSKEYPDASNNIAVIKILGGDIDGGIEQSKKTLEREPRNIIALTNLYMLYLEKDEPKTAAEYFSLIDEKNAKTDDEVFRLANVYFEKKDFSSAARLFKKLLVKKPFQLIIKYLYAVSLYNGGDFENAAAEFTSIANLNNGDLICEYYAKTALSLLSAGAKKAEFISGRKAFPKEIEEKYLKKIESFLKGKIENLDKFLSKKENAEILKWAINSENTNLQELAMFLASLTENRAVKNYAFNKLLDPAISNAAKGQIVLAIVTEASKTETVGIVISNEYKKVKIYPITDDGYITEAFHHAYASAYTRVVLFENINPKNVYLSAVNLIGKQDDLLNKFTFETLSAGIFYGALKLSGKKETDVSSTAKIFDADEDSLKTFIEIYYGEKNE